MTAAELIEYLKKFPQDAKVILFDEDAIPYYVSEVVAGGKWSHIVIQSEAE
jgi:hypothetical protein